MSRLLLRFLFVFLVISGHVHGSRVRRLRPLSVPVGKSAFIQPDDVIVPRDHNSTSCAIKVADDDVATLLRVGTVTPKVSDFLHFFYTLYANNLRKYLS